MRIAIIGGGIAGLAAAYELELAKKAGQSVEYNLFESSARLGGVLSSSVVDGTLIEHGPDSFLTEKPAAAELAKELGLASQLMPSNDAQRKTFILVRNRLVPLPDGLMFMIPTKLLPTALSPLFGIRTKLRMGLELLQKPRAHRRDESVASLVRRHYGQQMVVRLADPLLSGIYGGDAEQLSAQSVLPRMVAMEAKYGSLTRGTLVARSAQRAAAEAEDDLPPVAPRAIFTTFQLGLQQLVDAVVLRLDPRCLHMGAAVTRLSRGADGWRLLLADGRDAGVYDGLVLAVPAWLASGLLAEVDAELSAALEAIPYSSSATINLVFDGADLDALPEGFGFLVPAAERRAILACTFLHRKFPGRTAPGKSVLRVFVGGAHKADLLNETDAWLVELVRKELFEILQISAVPELTDVRRWPRAMAQYAVGHRHRILKIEERVSALPGLRLVGNAYDGIGISDCVRLGRKAARGLVSQVE